MGIYSGFIIERGSTAVSSADELLNIQIVSLEGLTADLPVLTLYTTTCRVPFCSTCVDTNVCTACDAGFVFILGDCKKLAATVAPTLTITNMSYEKGNGAIKTLYTTGTPELMPYY